MLGYLQRSLAAQPGLYEAQPVVLRRPTLLPGTISYALLLTFIVVIYTSPAVLFESLAAFGPAQIVGGAALLALAVEKTKNREGTWLVWPHSHLFAAFLWIAGLSCFTAVWARLTFESTLDLAKYFIIYIVLINTVNSERRLTGVLWTMALAGLFPCFGTLYNYVTGNIHAGERVHWVGIFANSNDLAYSIVLLVPLALGLSHGLSLRRRALLWSMIAVYTATIYVTFSRGSILGLFAVLLLIGLRHKAPSVRVITLGLIAASMVFIAYFWSRDEGFTNLSDFTFRQRLVTIQTGVNMFLDRPLLGVGLGGSVAAFPKYAPPDLDFSTALVIHNTFVQALSEVGILGCFFFTLFIVKGLLDARKVSKMAAAECRTRLAGQVDAVEISLWGFVVCGLFGPYMMSWFPFLLIGVVSAGLRLARRRNPGEVQADVRGASS
jgi:hypothetical protein